jgi:ATP-dependent DNA helicase RecQ
MPYNIQERQNKVLARERDNNTCVVCDEKDHLNVHHIIPKSHGGTNEVNNLITLCSVHHAAKHPETQLKYFSYAVFKIRNYFNKVMRDIFNLENKEKYLYALHMLTGSSQFRDTQLEIIESVMKNRDTLVVMPTGKGKSVCFQIPAILRDGSTLVISPLKALMYDQVGKLTSSYINSTYLNSDLDSNEKKQRENYIINKFFKLVYLAPERFFHQYNQYNFSDSKLLKTNYNLLVVDEAHCVDMWGRHFRPGYKKLGELREKIGNPPTIALTATASKRVQKEIIDSLGLVNPNIFVTGFYRPELTLSAIDLSQTYANSITLYDEKACEIEKILKDHKGEKTLIYVLTKKQGEELQEQLKRMGYDVPFYHSRVPESNRRLIHGLFSGEYQSDQKIIIATSAYGMGVDIKDIRVIVHYHMPSNIEDYYQQVGRAGRDGKPSKAYLLYSQNDEGLNRYMLDRSLASNKTLNEEEKKKVSMIENRELNTMLEFIKAKNLWKYILDYFGDTESQKSQNPNISVKSKAWYYGGCGDIIIITLAVLAAILFVLSMFRSL